MRADLVGPVNVVSFGAWGERGGVVYTPPRDTLDVRYALCVDHHVACDCREAEFSEERRETRAAYEELRSAFDAVLTGHGTYAEPPCMCSGCQVARAAHIWVRTAAAL